MDLAAILETLRSHANPENVRGMARYGINPNGTLGISMPCLHLLARQIGKDHALAIELWNSGIHEARILAALIAQPNALTEEVMDAWVKDFDSWDVCDQVCSKLFVHTPFAIKKAFEWSKIEEEYVRRAAFALMAQLAVHNKKMTDDQFLDFFPVIETYAIDERNYVKKAVNWALRQIGKRNRALNIAAQATANKISRLDSKSARWIASDALRELTSELQQTRLVR